MPCRWLRVPRTGRSVRVLTLETQLDLQGRPALTQSQLNGLEEGRERRKPRSPPSLAPQGSSGSLAPEAS